MYTPVLRRNCIYCGRANHVSNACRYRNINLAKITRDPETKQLKKHFSRKVHDSQEEDRQINQSLINKPLLTEARKFNPHRQGRKPESICLNGNRKTNPNQKKGDQKHRIPDSNSPDTNCKIVKEAVSTPKKVPAASPSSSNAARKYLGCKECVAWQMRLHQQANYWKEENKRLKNQQNIIDSLVRENMKLREEKNHWKDLFNLRDREKLNQNKLAKLFTPKI